jgi:hypothetical protein
LDVIGGIWHLLNFVAPAAGVGVIAASLAKLLWRGALQGVAWSRLALWASAWTLVACTGGLIVFGRDGKMATYGAMVLACATSLWWTGFGPRRR